MRFALLMIASVAAMVGGSYQDYRTQVCTVEQDFTFSGRDVLVRICKGGLTGSYIGQPVILSYLN